MKTWGDHIRRRRLELGLKQSDVAEQLGVTESAVWKWESNATSPAWRSWGAIIDFLGYNPLPEPGSYGERIVQFRKMRGLSQKAMARQIGIDPSTLGRWERGDRQPSGGWHPLLAICFHLEQTDSDGATLLPKLPEFEH